MHCNTLNSLSQGNALDLYRIKGSMSTLHNESHIWLVGGFEAKPRTNLPEPDTGNRTQLIDLQYVQMQRWAQGGDGGGTPIVNYQLIPHHKNF